MTFDLDIYLVCSS